MATSCSSCFYQLEPKIVCYHERFVERVGVMSTVEARIFDLLDSYARARHQCFLAEMFLEGSKREYVLCFRPLGVEKDSAGRYCCRYLRLATQEATALGQAQALSSSLAEKLDNELGSLGQLE